MDFLNKVIDKLYQEVTENRLIIFICFFFLHLLLGILHPRLAELRGTTFGRHLSFTPMARLGGDYICNYTAANALIYGYNIYQDNRQHGEKFTDPYGTELNGLVRFIYPPLILYLAAPFALFSFYTSYKLWILFNLVILIITIYFLSRFVGTHISAFIFLTAFYFQSAFLYFYLERGQFDIIVFFFLVLCLYFYHIRGNNILCALFLAIAAGLKVYPGFQACSS